MYKFMITVALTLSFSLLGISKAEAQSVSLDAAYANSSPHGFTWEGAFSIPYPDYGGISIEAIFKRTENSQQGESSVRSAQANYAIITGSSSLYGDVNASAGSALGFNLFPGDEVVVQFYMTYYALDSNGIRTGPELTWYSPYDYIIVN